MNNLQKRKAIQALLGVPPDGIFGPVTRKAFEALAIATDAPPDTTPEVDERSEKNIATLLPEVQPFARKLVHEAAKKGITIKVTSALRTYAEQDALYAQGRTKPGSIVTNARGGQSAHNFGLAFDVTEFNGTKPVWESDNYDVVGEIGQKMGLDWGGSWRSFTDRPHFAFRPKWSAGMSESRFLAELRDRKERGVSLTA